MKILGLYNNTCAVRLFDYLESIGHTVVRTEDKLTPEWCREQDFDLAVSYTYKYILSEEILDALKGNVVNIHNSYLPYNRGASPNLWSLAEGTPRGVTLHYMDAGLDKGYIIAQKHVTDGDGETLKSSYDNLDENAFELFKEAFADYDRWPEMKRRAEGQGSYHSVKDTHIFDDIITSYDMKITDFVKKAREII
ncbi:MAG: hypothetical protein K6G57_01390 [Lachnospiraceae bacterium]|nr:hypothetical protein [Lachnospiraceae bacterium]